MRPDLRGLIIQYEDIHLSQTVDQSIMMERCFATIAGLEESALYIVFTCYPSPSIQIAQDSLSERNAQLPFLYKE